MKRQPLNGTRTHPLSPAAMEILRRLRDAPIPSSQINPGLHNRLVREGCVHECLLPSPFKTHKGKLVAHLALRAQGKEGAT